MAGYHGMGAVFPGLEPAVGMWAKEKKAAWSKVYNAERREWYKAHGICCQCGASPARLDRTLCADCAKIQHNRTERSDPGRRRDYTRTVERKADRYAAGLCATCGKRPYRPGHKSCELCAKKQRDRDTVRRVKRRLDRQIEAERNRLIELERERRANV